MAADESSLGSPTFLSTAKLQTALTIEKERLLSLIEFAQQSARLRTNPVSTVTQHNHFALYENQLRDRPGISLNIEKRDGEDEIWLVVERLHETKPPEVTSAILKPWIEMTQGPDTEPKLKATTDGASLIAAGTHRSSLKQSFSDQEATLQPIDPPKTLTLADYGNRVAVKAHFQSYLDNNWHPWAEQEKRRRWTIRLYSQLFTLKQQLEGGIVEAQLEFVWGVGLGIWQCDSTTVGYPLVTRLVELNLNPGTAEIEIRPRDVDARLEVDWYASVDNPGVANVECAAKEFFGKATKTFSPFDRGTFEPLLRAAVTHLDPNGVYWPDEVPAEDRTLPKAEGKLKVTDTWVLFVRPRTNSLFIQDLEHFKKVVRSIEDARQLPQAVAAVVTEPAADNKPVELPVFRGASASYHAASDRDLSRERKVYDLYFPKPFNDEQVRIVQLLEVSDGVVVQGPPGTGKTHTIANVICHYLANGRRVLVTSMKDPALAVLQDHLPGEIRPLAISLLTSEQEGMKQFEFAIQKIASEVQLLDRHAMARAISHLEETIDAFHGKLTRIDHDIAEWARKNLEPITLDNEEIAPQDAAREVVEGAGQYEWIPDALGVDSEFSSRISNEDVVRLREARRTLGPDISYLGCSLPQLVEFPDSKRLLQVHQDLSRFATLTNEVESGQVPALADSGQETLGAAQELIIHIEQLRTLYSEIADARKQWTVAMSERLRSGQSGNLIGVFEALGSEIEETIRERNSFLERPVATPAGFEVNIELVAAVSNLAQGKSAFGVMGLFGKSEQKRLLGQVIVLGNHPVTAEDWAHVASFVALQKRLRDLAVRWNVLAPALKVDALPGVESEHGIAAAESFALYRHVKVAVEVERTITQKATKVFPTWDKSREVAENHLALAELESALRHHMAKNRLAEVWAVKERLQRVLDGKSGPVVDRIGDFLANTLGSPEVPDAEMQGKWSALMAEVSRVLGLRPQLDTVAEICHRVQASGAPKLAHALKQPLEGVTDPLLPDNWRQAWHLKRLATYLELIDPQEELKKLAKARAGVESDLVRGYQDIVVKRTWLKLAENASPSIRAALQAYLNAIQKIGKGTGKRAVRYRQDARSAAQQANPAVPCWIMPHYRVSESLPAELGCFDLVVIDEASQSDLTALPALLRASKVLIVGDDKQVSPEGVGLEEEKVRSLMNRFLGNQVLTYRPQMSPERSIYDLFKVVFAKSAVMLREHFRCVAPVIEYSKREFYNHELRPLRIPRTSERIDPPLVDVMIEDGYRRGDVNKPEIRFIVDEISKLVSDPRLAHRSIGVVSLLGDKQAYEVWERLTEKLGPEEMQRHRIACGDARTFQGKERDIMFLTMVSAPNDVGAPLSRDTFAQRFNVAASRARDRMYLVRSVELEHLSDKDIFRNSLIHHFAAPFAQDEVRVGDLRKLCESPFEREVYNELTQRGYWVTPQVRVGQFRIDLVVQGHNDARLAVECDGDKYHGADKWADDMQRQRVLERAGWVFWRCFASTWMRRRKAVLEDLLKTLEERGIESVGGDGAPRSVHTEYRRIRTASTSV